MTTEGLLSVIRRHARPGLTKRFREASAGPSSAITEPERYALSVLEWATRLSRVPTLLRLTASLVRNLQVPKIDGSFGMYTVQSHHLIVHRTLLSSASDTAVRLVAAVWDLQVPEAALINERVVTGNGRITQELKDCLKRFGALAQPYRSERNDILHAGGVPLMNDYAWTEHWARAEAAGGSDDDFFAILAEGAAEDRQKMAEAIERESGELVAAYDQLLLALTPSYDRQHQMLLAAI